MQASSLHRYIVPFLITFPAAASDLSYTLMSPNFGGVNGTAFSMAQQEKSLKAAHAQAEAQAAAARAAAAASASTTVSPANAQNQAFINAIISQLTGLVAYRVAAQIANSSNGQAGSVQSGDTTISYVNSGGNLSVTLTSPSGSTTLTVPTGL